jgi:ABC-type transport system involved in cytochrome bd biosynthesis fused ATPase/permease subunit
LRQKRTLKGVAGFPITDVQGVETICDFGRSPRVLIVENLALTYSDGTEAIRGVSLQVGKGVFGLWGPNGAGKSSLMQVLATLRQPAPGHGLAT